MTEPKQIYRLELSRTDVATILEALKYYWDRLLPDSTRSRKVERTFEKIEEQFKEVDHGKDLA